MDSWERVKGEIREAIKDWPPLVRSGVHWVTEYPLWLLAAFVGLLYWMLPDDDFWATMKFAIEVTIAVVALVFFYRRLRNQDKQVAHQIEKEIDDRFISAVGLLGSAESSARTGAIYSLYQLFTDEGGEKYRPQIAQILCSHIRTKTQEPEYQKNHQGRPSNEIQTAIDLLFKDVNGNRGIYCRSEIVKQNNFPVINLQCSFLCGANFWEAHCEDADFVKAHCERADFTRAYCEGADFAEAHCEGAEFDSAHCERASFIDAHCVGVRFECAYCMMTCFDGANCAGANLSAAYCHYADFQNADFRGSYSGEEGCLYFLAATMLKKRIGEDTDLFNVTFSGDLGEEYIQYINEARPYIGENLYNDLHKIVEENRRKESDNTIPVDMITGVLEDSPELQKVIQKLEEIEKKAKN